MYKLVFADDEGMVRNNIKRIIDWEGSGFKLVGCVSNGAELIEKVEQENPDVVITDISMPFVDGIEAARSIREEHPATKILFLTGHDDFDYAQQAVDLKIEKYILKPITASKLRDVLDKLKSQLDKEKANKRDVEFLAKFRDEHIQSVRYGFINDLLLSQKIDEKVIEDKANLGIPALEGDKFQVALILDDGYSDVDVWKGVSQDLIAYAIFNIAQELVEESQLGTALIVEGVPTLVLSNYDDKDKSFKTEQLLTEILTIIDRYLGFTATIGVGRVYSSISQLNLSYREARSALWYRHLEGHNQLLLIDDMEPHRDQDITFQRNQETDLMSAVRTQDQVRIEDIIHNATLVSNGDANKIQVMGILLAILREAEYAKISLEEITSSIDINTVLYARPEVINNMLLETAKIVSEKIGKQRESKFSDTIKKSVDYIEKNLNDPDLSVKTISKQVHLSVSYFRSIFKKEMGITIGNYINQERMEKAKKLITTTEMKNYEVAEKIGFTDPHYFSYSFKRYFDKTPSEVRE